MKRIEKGSTGFDWFLEIYMWSCDRWFFLMKVILVLEYVLRALTKRHQQRHVWQGHVFKFKDCDVPFNSKAGIPFCIHRIRKWMRWNSWLGDFDSPTEIFHTARRRCMPHCNREKNSLQLALVSSTHRDKLPQTVVFAHIIWNVEVATFTYSSNWILILYIKQYDRCWSCWISPKTSICFLCGDQ